MEFLRLVSGSLAWPLWLVVVFPALAAVVVSFVEGWSSHAASYFDLSAFRVGAWLGAWVVLPVTVLVGLPIGGVTVLRSCVAGGLVGVAAGLVGTGMAWCVANYRGLGSAWKSYRLNYEMGSMLSFFRSFVTDRWDDRYERDKYWRR